MLGKRKPQHSYFDALGLPHCVSPDPFYGRKGSLNRIGLAGAGRTEQNLMLESPCWTPSTN